MLADSEDEGQIIERVAALDIGKAEVVCCVRIPGTWSKRLQEVSTHSTMTRSLSELANHLVTLGTERVVMEATWDYWKPVFYLLEVAECQMLRPSFVPPDPVRRLRDLPATGSTWSVNAGRRRTGSRSSWRTHPTVGRRLGSLGVSGREMMAALIAGERDPAVLGQMARSRMRTQDQPVGGGVPRSFR